MTTPLQQTVLSGSLLLAAPVALAAGLVSFLSPCVLPLVPGYLSYVTGMAGADLDGDSGPARTRLIAGAALFVLGFTAVFVSFGAFFGGLGSVLLAHAGVLTRVMGAVTVVLGLVFLGAIPAWRSFKLASRPAVGLGGAPLLGALFAVGWTPCVGPTLAAVQALAFTESSAGRGAFLSAVYCLGLGAPFLAAALMYRRALGAFAWVRQRSVWVMRAGGVMLVVVGLLLLTGVWTELTIRLQGWISGFETVL